MAAPSGSTRTPSMVTPRSSAAERRLDTDEPPAVAHQRHRLLLEHGAVGDGLPARGRLGGEVGTEAAHELLVRDASQPGDPPAPLESELDDVAADRAGGAGHEQGAPLAVAEDVHELDARGSALSGTVAASTRSRSSGTTATSAAGSTSCSA